MTLVEVISGDSPIVLGMPHTGTLVAPEIEADLNDNGRTLADTDWHIDRLYDDLLPGVTAVRATFHRYVIDANRDPTGDSLYPGQNTTALVPMTDFDGVPIWDRMPDADEVAARCRTYHAAYHAALQAELDQVRARHGFAILFDCHSIRSQIPFLFDGVLPDLNIGTNDGTTCSKEIEASVAGICYLANGYTSILNGRFKGGWTTRHYGRPADGVHAIQMEIAQSAYLATETSPWAYDVETAAPLRRVLKNILDTIRDTAAKDIQK